MTPHISAHTRRHQKSHHFQNDEYHQQGLHILGDVAKKQPGDTKLEDLVDMDIPGLVTPTTRFFDFVEAKVRAQFGDLSRKRQDVIVRILAHSRGVQPNSVRDSRHISSDSILPVGP